MKNRRLKLSLLSIETSYNRNERNVNLKKGENIGRNKGQVWKGKKDEGMKRKKFARSRIIDHGFVLCSVF